MKLDEAEREIFCEIQQEFINEFGEKALFAVYRMHRKFSNRLGFKNFPTKESRDSLLYDILSSERFAGASLHQIFLELEKEMGIRESTFYSFYHNYFIPRKKEERKRSLLK
jgi:hypothetical protein